MPQPSELRSRWLTAETRSLRQAADRWLAGAGQRPEDLRSVGGRADLRGFPVSGSPRSFGHREDPGSGPVWHSLDLSHARADAVTIVGGEITDCLFEAASLVDLQVDATTLEDCSFRRADLRMSTLGSAQWQGRRTVWRRVDFTGAALKRGTFSGCLLERCTFEGNGRLWWITNCELQRCTFRGTLGSLTLDGGRSMPPTAPPPLSADFSGAVLRDSMLIGYRLDDAILPTQDDLVVIRHYRQVCGVAAAWLVGRATTEPERHAARVLDSLAATPHALDSDWCGAIDDRVPEYAAAMKAALDHARNTEQHS